MDTSHSLIKKKRERNEISFKALKARSHFRHTWQDP